MSKETHDRKVRQIAKELKNKRWKVQADLRNYDTPAGIGKNSYIPDIVATRGKKTKIIEVDTPKTVDNDQLASFRRSAAQRKNTNFEHVITRPRN